MVIGLKKYWWNYLNGWQKVGYLVIFLAIIREDS